MEKELMACTHWKSTEIFQVQENLQLTKFVELHILILCYYLWLSLKVSFVFFFLTKN